MEEFSSTAAGALDHAKCRLFLCVSVWVKIVISTECRPLHRYLHLDLSICSRISVVLNQLYAYSHLWQAVLLYNSETRRIVRRERWSFWEAIPIKRENDVFLVLSNNNWFFVPHVRNEEVLLRVSEQRNILYEIWKRKANWSGHVLRRNCLLKQVIYGKTKWHIEVTRRRGRRRKKLLDDLGDRRGYSHLKEEALDRIKWRNRFGRGCGPVVWQITDDVVVT
jgi:hypothetical protein